MAAAAAGLYRAAAARQRVSLFLDPHLAFSPKIREFLPISECSTSYGLSCIKTVLAYCSEREKSIASSSRCHRIQLPSLGYPDLVMRRYLSTSSQYWRQSSVYDPRSQGIISPPEVINPWSEGIIDPSLTLVKAPIWQISFVSSIDYDKEDFMSIDEFCYMNPLWKLLDSPLVSREEGIHVLDSPWRHFYRVMAVIGSYNNSHGVTTYPSFFKHNIKISRRFLEPVLIDPVGVRFDDPILEAIIQYRKVNGSALTFHAIARLFHDIAKGFPEIITPSDVDYFLELMKRNVISDQDEMLIVNNPCLLSYTGRVHFTHYAHFKFLTELAQFRSLDPEFSLREDVLSALGRMMSSDGNTALEENISSNALLNKIFTHRGRGILTAHDMRKAALMKGFDLDDIPVRDAELVLRGALFLGLQWNLIKHSLDPEILRDPKIISLGDYSIGDVVDLAHGKIPLGLTTIGDIALSHQRVPELSLDWYFPPHPDAFKAKTI